jgi:hypothetical protein
LNLVGFELFSEIHTNTELGAVGREENGADRAVAFRAIKRIQQLVAKLDVERVSAVWVV